MNDHLTIVPAGAGSGKTYRIEKTLAGWVEDKLIEPGRILAVTFTEAAASELRSRIRAELMSRGRIEDALEIDRAYVGTIHALGQRLLTEHAFAAGRSPESRLLSEPERDILIRIEMSHCASLTPLMADLARFGYAWSPQTGKSAEDSFRTDLLRTVDLLRGLGARGSSKDILDPAIIALDEGYGVRAPEGASLTDALRRAAQALLTSFPSSRASEATSDSAAKDFNRDFNNLRRAANTDALNGDWALWQALRNMRRAKRGSSTPEGYDTAAGLVMEAAEGLLCHPGPLEDAKAHLTALVTGGQEVLAAYDDAKRRAGLIDYSDMIVEAEKLLRTRPDILSAVLSEIDCVVIDEFQDTNPVQFALLWRLARGAGRALIVGDTKQSIMGFQGADPRLADALQAAHPGNIDPLDRNWRSDPRIMELVNRVGEGLFPDRYNALAPTREETGETALEAIDLPRSWLDRRNHTPDCIADRVAKLISDGAIIWDKKIGKNRPVQPSDIAVLCYTSSDCARTAEAIRSRALPVRIQSEGWLNAPATRAARAALAYAADPDDTHAALSWLTLGAPCVALQDALKSAVDGVLDTHVGLAKLHSLSVVAKERPVGDLVSEVIRVTGLREWVAGLKEPSQALADLARFEAEAQEFDNLALDLRAAAGFHGCGPQVFLGWIAAQTEKDWDRHPDTTAWSGTGVEISTWHAAKGREWPITIVAGLDFKFPERPGALRAEFERFDDLENVLDHAGFGWLPDFAAPEKQQPYADSLIDADERGAARALYVALTRARDRLILVLPAEPSGDKERPERMVDLLRVRTNLSTKGSCLTLGDTTLPAYITIEDRERYFPDGALLAERPVRRFGSAKPTKQNARTAWRRSPSSIELVDASALPPLSHVVLASGIGNGSDHFEKATDRGTAWHQAFRTLSNRPDLQEALSSSTGLDAKTLEGFAKQAKAIRDWLGMQGYDKLYFELPLQEVRADGSETNAIIDCLAESADSYLILDHKSGACPDPDTRFANYLPQLQAYADLIAARGGKPVRQMVINWMNEGMISVAPAGQKEIA